MERALRTADEIERLRALHRMGVLDTPPEERFDRITRRVTDAFDVPISLVSLVDDSRQWFKSFTGLDVSSTGRDESFCAHAIHHDELFLVEDAAADERFADNPLVTGAPHIRFYAGRPLHASTGERVGTLCVIDRRPRILTAEQRSLLDDLGAWAEAELRAGEMRHVAAAFSDLAELREQITSTVSHEMRNPLSSVRTSIEMLVDGEEGEPTPGQAELLGVASRNTARLMALVDDLLLLATLDAEPASASNDLVDIGALAEDVVLECMRTTRSSIDVVAKPDVVVRGSAERLRQAIANLVGNAVKYSDAGSCVRVEVRTVDGDVRVDVTDRGVGIGAEDLPRITERFFRAGSAGSVPGTGLGLSITRAIAEHHHGRLEVRSELGRGSTFSLVLPAAN